MTTSVVTNSVFRGFFEKQKLTGPNFIDWYRQLRIVLLVEDKLDYLEQPIPPAPVPTQAGQQVAPEALAAHNAWVKGSKEIVGLMLMTMEPDIQQNLENLSAYDMLQELKTLFAQQAKQELLQTVRNFHFCKQEEGQSVSSYVLKMKSYIHNLERLGHPVSLNLGESLILISLRKEFDRFVQNYNMHSMGKSVNEFHAMLKIHKQTLTKKDPTLHAIRAGKVQKKNNKQNLQVVARGPNQGKGKSKLAYAPKSKIPPPPKRKIQLRTQSIINAVIQVYDTGCGTHICNTTHGLRGSKKLKPGALSLYVGNGQRVVVKAIGTYHLSKLNLDSALLWHYRLGHISKKRIEKLQHDGLLNSTDLRAFEKCVPCMSGNMARKPYTHQVERAKDLLGLIHTDVCGPFKITSRQGASYFVTFTEDFSRYGYVYLLKHKHEVFETFKVFQKEVENQLGKTIKSLRSDRRGEYMSQEFLDHLKDYGIMAHRTPLYTPQHNGVFERINRTLLDMVRSMMSQTTLLKSFWDYALETAARILIWGCEALVKRDTLSKPDKLEPRSIKCIFVGYPKETMGYSFYYPLENKVLVAQNAEFLENYTSLNHEEDDLEIDEPQSDIIPIRRSTRTRHAIDRICLYINAEEHELGDLGELTNYKAALLDHESDKWLNWLFKKKTDIDGAVHTFEARLVVKGFTQTYGVDYEETFYPVAYIRDIRILIAIAAYYDNEIWQMDVKTAFLNGHLSKEVYMEQPEGFVNQKYPNRVCKLKRSIYGLKQASRQWNKRFDDEIKKFGFTQNLDEPCVYLKASGSNVTFLILYVDDILIIGNNIPMLQDVKSYLGRCFAMKDLGKAAYILGIKIYRDRS
ncbi:retrotransposon protein, putative, ty1-copia subclass [Tanacetum coccineum]|uniref:Retrotransposon protein, putative, ty1-copia subclass n=1 Tax=Tanacetum coccineum TaxID=301880 RepID=A0ABQ5G4B1_9ASTR